MLRAIAVIGSCLTLGAATAAVVAVACAAATSPTQARPINAMASYDSGDGQFVGYLRLEGAAARGTWSLTTGTSRPRCGFGEASLSNDDESGEIRARIPDELQPILLPWIDAKAPWPQTLSSSGPRILAAGWPLPCLWCEYAQTPTRAIQLVPVGGIALEESPTLSYPAQLGVANPRTIPLRPLWRGLTLNSLLFASIWALPFAAFGTRRHLLSSRRNLCRACAYPRLGLAPDTPCPECGLSTTTPTARPAAPQ